MEPANFGRLQGKELGGFEKLANLLELLQLTTSLLEFFFALRHVVLDSVNLVNHDFHRRFLFPWFPVGLTRYCGSRHCRIRWLLCCCHCFLLVLRVSGFVRPPIGRAFGSLRALPEAQRVYRRHEHLDHSNAPSNSYGSPAKRPLPSVERCGRAE